MTEKNGENISAELTESDSTRELHAEYDTRRRCRSDDASAMQAAVCAVLAVAVFLLNTVISGTAQGIFAMIKDFSADTTELFANPTELLFNLLD